MRESKASIKINVEVMIRDTHSAISIQGRDFICLIVKIKFYFGQEQRRINIIYWKKKYHLQSLFKNSRIMVKTGCRRGRM